MQRQLVSALQVHAGEEVTTVIDGEALVDDGIAAVLYAIFLERQVNSAVTNYALLSQMPCDSLLCTVWSNCTCLTTESLAMMTVVACMPI